MAREDVIELALDDPLHPKTASAHLYLPCEGEVSQVVLTVKDSGVPDDLKVQVPVQFQMRFGEDVVGTYLKRTGDGYAVQMNARVLASVIAMLSHDKSPEEDLSVGYWVRGRRLGEGAEWVDYATGLVTFTCGADDSRRMDSPVKSRHAVKKPPPKQFMPGDFKADFLSASDTPKEK